ncbi:PREDICTED: uncharacterized protein LOC106887694 [Calidris pugnax]|uniref:uncharacterized protein LOC106887694 n=1 Tax=Calidris pugnax TaxID=198806 RepID=UPI00071CCD82|nr:PREDICTED: uncharacterized protein LOC106887694 [Calidris pugnax]
MMSWLLGADQQADSERGSQRIEEDLPLPFAAALLPRPPRETPAISQTSLSDLLCLVRVKRLRSRSDLLINWCCLLGHREWSPHSVITMPGCSTCITGKSNGFSTNSCLP